MNDDVTLCLIGSSTPHRAHDGYLCDNHAQRLADTLRDIETEYALLSAVPSMAMRPGRSGSLKSHRSPAILDAIVATDKRRGTGHIGSDHEDPWGLDDTASVLDTLHNWARAVREERGLAGPTRRGPRVRMASQPYAGPFCEEECLHSSCDRMTFWPDIPADPTISSERDTLSRHLSWVCAQEWVDDAYADLARLLGQLRATNGTAAPRPIARCHLPASFDGVSQDPPQVCGGGIYADDTNGCAYCAQCRETWTAPQLLEINALLEEARRPRTDDGRIMLTVNQIVTTYGLKANAVRVRLSRAGIKGVDGYYDTAVFEGVSA